MKLNADIGELTGNDLELIPHLDMANIACGFHASTPHHMRKTVKLCQENRVSIGAHPSYPDRQNFGRVSMSLTTDKIYDLIFGQVELLTRIAASEATKVDYLKPHGALYHDMMDDPDIYSAIVRIASHFDLDLMISARPDIRHYIEIALVREVTVIKEVFADRSYRKDGVLSPRSEPHSIHTDTQKIIVQASDIISSNSIICETGENIKLQADTICLHGDNPASVLAASSIHQLLHLNDT